MIENYFTSIAEQFGIKLTSIKTTASFTIGISDNILVKLFNDQHVAVLLLQQNEIEDIQNGTAPERLYLSAKQALFDLKFRYDAVSNA